MRRDRENQLDPGCSQARGPVLDPVRVSPYRPAALTRPHKEAGHTTAPDRSSPNHAKNLLASREASTHGSRPGRQGSARGDSRGSGATPGRSGRRAGPLRPLADSARGTRMSNGDTAAPQPESRFSMPRYCAHRPRYCAHPSPPCRAACIAFLSSPRPERSGEPGSILRRFGPAEGSEAGPRWCGRLLPPASQCAKVAVSNNNPTGRRHPHE